MQWLYEQLDVCLNRDEVGDMVNDLEEQAKKYELEYMVMVTQYVAMDLLNLIESISPELSKQIDDTLNKYYDETKSQDMVEPD